MKRTFKIEGMGCMHCVNTIEKNIGAIESVNDIKVSLENASMMLDYDELRLSDETISVKVAELGYKCII